LPFDRLAGALPPALLARAIASPTIPPFSLKFLLVISEYFRHFERMNTDVWNRWEATTDFRRRVQESAARHRLSPDVSPEAYLEGKRVELERELEGKILIYLDTKHWVNLCNVVVQSQNSLPIYDTILAHLEPLRQKGRICCPLSFPLWEELMKQNDIKTRQATAQIMDFLSGGVCLQNWLTIAKAEFAFHICRTFQIGGSSKPEFSFWTKIGYWIGEHTFKFPELTEDDGTLMEKVYIDFHWEMTVQNYQAMPDRIPTPDSFASAWVKEAERSQLRQIEKKESFANLVRRRRRQLLSELRDTLLPVLALCQGVAGSPDDHVAAVLDPVHDGQDPNALPSLEVIAGLDAAICMETKRKVQPNDMLDYLHAAQALPYCDALFCDNFMSQKMRNKPLEFGKVYQTEIGSRPEEILQYLKTLT
jgi:hypothetical protein